MSDDYQKQLLAYNEDKRTACKYGDKCYQKNPKHLEKFKHPPSDNLKEFTQATKKQKLNNGESNTTHASKIEKDGPENEDNSELNIENQSENEDNDTDKEHQNTTKTNNSQVDTKPESELTESEFIQRNFLVKMPDDFYKFWEFCKIINEKDPLHAFEKVDLVLVGPFDVLAGKFQNVTKTKNEYLRHWRYYYDPPEMQTVIKCYDKEGYHIGYYRDEPLSDPCFVCSGNLINGQLTIMAGNLFGAVNVYLDNYVQKKCTPFNKMGIVKFQTKLKDYAKTENITLETKTDEMKSRNNKVVTRTFSGIGIVVPYNKKTQLGYRPLIETKDKIKKLLNNIVEAKEDGLRDDFLSKLQPIITMASIAADECDFGTSLELGLDLFNYGGEVFHNIILSLLISSYQLLGRDSFGDIMQAHLQDRKKSNNLSIL
ncbi:histone PARylation factor 1 [Chrysoperla carnea]|uniref:histone PARylation factor 1 n=1 Tax=Chrysoperla carnea TaxID=189513 RepID=UPI001D060C5D|nr:histone PARylation factor 1 [Chrysoperla carnea]